METTEKTVRAFELEDHGTDYAQYFPGAGIALTDFEDIGTGVGNTPAQALEDALEVLAMSGWSIPEDVERELREELGPAEHAERDYVSKRGSKWEVHEPEGCSLVPDDCGELVLDSNEEEREELRSKLEEDGSELHYYVSVRVSSELLQD